MGCAILLIGPRGGETNITPGWRSKMHTILIREFGDQPYSFSECDIPRLKEIAENQEKGIADPPFDWAEDIEKSFNRIIAHIEKHGFADVEVVF